MRSPLVLWAIGHRVPAGAVMILAALLLSVLYGAVSVPVPVFVGRYLPPLTVSALVVQAYPVVLGLFFYGNFPYLESISRRSQRVPDLGLLLLVWIVPLMLGIQDAQYARNASMVLTLFTVLATHVGVASAMGVVSGWILAQSLVFGISQNFLWKILTGLLRETSDLVSWGIVLCGIIITLVFAPKIKSLRD